MDNNVIIVGGIAIVVVFLFHHTWRGEQLRRKDEQLAEQQVYIDDLLRAARKLRRAQLLQGQGRFDQRVATPRFLQMQDAFDMDDDFTPRGNEEPFWMKVVGLVFAGLLIYGFGQAFGFIP